MLGDYFEAYERAGIDRLSVYEFMLLVHVYEGNLDWIRLLYEQNYLMFTNAVVVLERTGYIKKYGTAPFEITLRRSGEEFFAKYVKKPKKKKESDVYLWFDSWRNLFPEGSNTAGYRYRGNRLEGLKKMTKFAELYPEFTKEEIFQATKNYVDKFAIRGYNYMQQAHYFIEKKDSGSTLASECEGLKEKDEQSKPSRYDRLI